MVAPRLSADVLRRAGPEAAAAVAVVDQDDVANLDSALVAREVKPGVRIVAADILWVLAGVALVPAITAAVVEMVVRIRLTAALGGPTEPILGRVVVVGLRNVGTRVVRELHDFGVDVAGVDLDEKGPGRRLARELGIPVVLGDGRRPKVLRSASVQTCRTLVVVSVDDLVNLEVALADRALHRLSPASGFVAGIAPPASSG